MKLLHVAPFFQEQYGGTERYCYNLCRELVKRNHDVEVFTARIKPDSPPASETEGIHVRRFSTPTIVWNINPLSFMLRSLVKSDYDIVHVHSYLYFASDQAVLAKVLRSALRRRTRLVLHIHGGVGSPSYLTSRPAIKVLKNVYDLFIGRLMVRAADAVLSADRASAKAAVQSLGVNPRTVAIIHNGINFSECSRQQNQDGHDSHTLLYVGDLERWKGIETLLQAMRILHDRGNGFSLKLVGDGTERRQLETLAQGLDVEFAGQRPHEEVPKMMSEAFAVTLPSLWEGIPTVGLEAMATRTPFVATNVGGIPEIVENNVTGLLVPRNNPQALANAIIRLEDTHLRTQLTRNAFRRVQEQFNIAQIAGKLEGLYETLLDR